MKVRFILLLSALLLWMTPVSAQVPEPLSQEAVYIAFPMEITLDGVLDDWANIPQITVTTGTMTSLNPAENGSFTFAVAADEAHLYVTMTMPDATIITGQHGENYWNEDSLEFYVNFSDELFTTAYNALVYQININPGDIGNSDPSAITVTGTNSAASGIEAFVFSTDDGWGFEAALPYPEGFTPEHGDEIGFQAHANGSSGSSRDVKLIWAAADETDTSYQDPSVFGIGVFFEQGRTDIPEPTERMEPVIVEEQQSISINQVGYFPDAPKFGMLANGGNSRTAWMLVDDTNGEPITAGVTTAGTFDAASGNTVQIADFSDFSEPGRYRLIINGVSSVPFVIAEDIYTTLSRDALRYFYLNRSGMPLEAQYAGESWARAAGHITDDNVTCFAGTDADGITWDGCDYILDVRGGWYDAGDFGKYVVNGGIAVWTLLNLYERFPERFDDSMLNIPESGNNTPDLLDEARWQMNFLLAMQVPEGQPLAGMVHHKMHDIRWEPMPMMPPTEVENDNEHQSSDEGRYLYPPSTAATLNMAATAAQCARIWMEIDTPFAERCLNAARTAWDAANANPIMLAGNTPGEGGGNYPDDNVTDEFFWAAAELYITTGEAQYADYLQASPQLDMPVDGMYWGETAALGKISLASTVNDFPQRDALREQIVVAATQLADVVDQEGYRVPMTVYDWGSNSTVLNNAILLAYAYDFTDDPRYLNGVLSAMDYILGTNSLTRSFVSGYGTETLQNPHHRFWGNQPEIGFPPPPPGVVAGGPNANPSDPTALASANMDAGPAQRYVDMRGSWSTNEVTINWNAPLSWIANYLSEHFEDTN